MVRKRNKILSLVIPIMALKLLPLNSVENLVLAVTITLCSSITVASVILDSEDEPGEDDKSTFNMVFKTRK